ncbi:precorrin-4 C(11)-methyltransferase [Desulforamulus hydrothermalis]|uniref:Cobalt-precorrin-4 C(11)-methyltransferase n=1 Tax=Desulforamulus hydrothermalis Lam5 = DSM 18033 TaxID=1121428 RepID=K8DYT9_9FIRM|nr:precorrin-4 C(11)-methyltransferase [Desulforamulus hydrothermalis]CCO07980.1 Cobalt-precorrin-4 C(11)-methyltransferase [Desulforamulus hydrothermalis Lam5 = DSM 18033]SHG84879.1 cobalt-precorrin 4 C11-methyltransferase [Desulforamulus hydrothermalis Lam5 = DSM 18033]
MIYFVGAGPGDPELLTVKAQRLLQQADLVLYTGSLVPRPVLDCCRPDAVKADSAGMVLQQIVDLMVHHYRQGKLVVRLHTGDPALYGAIGEQMAALDQLGISYRVVPGVSSFLAAAAAVQREYTVPGGSQTVIITRLAGRTPVPPEQSLASLARHKASLAIFLSVGLIQQVQQELLQGYEATTPVAVVERVTWPQERIIRGNLGQLARLVEEAGITRTALILVGEFLAARGSSLLYDAGFAHGYRAGE